MKSITNNKSWYI